MITVGNTINFQLERITSSGTINEGTVEVIRKEFNALDYDGVGYQRVLIQDNFGKTASHGIGSNADQTSLQIDAVAFALPLYRFDFSFMLTNQKLKEVMELYLRLYNFRSQGERVRLRMTDNRLYISEPIDVDGAVRSGNNIGETAEQTIQNDYGYRLKQVEYLISWENIEWMHHVGDIYSLKILGTEVEVESDANTGNICFPAEEEIGPTIFSGFVAEEIPLPSHLTQGGVTYDCYGVGRLLDDPNNKYFGHFKVDDNNYFVAWREGAPGVNGDTSVDYEALYSLSSDWDLTQGPTNTRINSDTISYLLYEPDSTLVHVREFRPLQPGTFSNSRESDISPLLVHGWGSCTEEFQNFFTIVNGTAEVETVLVPRLVLRPGNTLTDGSISSIREQFDWGGIDYVLLRPTIAEWATNSEGQVTGDESNSLNASARRGQAQDAGRVPPEVPSNRLFSIQLTNQSVASNGSWFIEQKLNVDIFTSLSIDFDFVLNQSAGNSNDFGEGFALVLHDDPRGAAALGGGSYNLGFGGWNGTTLLTSVAITPSIAITFDTVRNGSLNNEPTGGSGTPHYVRIILDGATQAPVFEQVSTFDFTSTEYSVNVFFSGTLNSITIEIVPLSGGVPEVINYVGINLGTYFTSNEIYMGFTGGTSNANSNWHHINRLTVNTNATWALPGAQSKADAYVIDRTTGGLTPNLVTTNLTRTETDDLFTDLVTIASPSEGNDVFYTIFRDRDDVNVTKVYKTSGFNPYSAGRVLISELAAGELPLIQRGIQSPQGEYKFYLTQGNGSGNVYSTTNWTTFTLVGSWDEKDAAETNEGQLYWYLNRYIVRSPSRFLLDTTTDTFVDIATLFCDNTTAEYDALFDAGREIIACVPTPYFDPDYATADEEQLMIVSRRSDGQDLKMIALKDVDECPP